MNAEKIQRAIKFIDSWLDFRYERNEWPGFTIAISHKGKILFNKSYGYANIETKEKLTPNHIFRIASHSKTFTATAIMQLIEKKKLKLDDFVIQYLPWLQNHKDKRFGKVTIKQLLSHSAGIIRDGLDADYWLLTHPFPEKDQFKKEVLTTNLVFNNGEKMKYSDIGYTLLGLVVEEVSGTSYNNYVSTNIVQPLKLKGTGPEYTNSINDRLITGYSMRGNTKKRFPFIKTIKTKVMSSATGFYSTSEDLCLYFEAQMIGSGKLLNDTSKIMMQKGEYKIQKSDFKEKYGLGFVVTILEKNVVFGHLGAFPGQSTETLCDPKNKLVITVLTNCIDGNADLFANGIYSIISYFENNYIKNPKSSNLDKFQGRFINIWFIIDIISMGNYLVSVDPDVYNPFECTEKLKYLNTNIFKIGKTNGFYFEGELIHYLFKKNGKVKSMRYAGLTMLPEKNNSSN